MSADDPAAVDMPASVDYRFTLANERTFLAWIRTALGLVAGAVAIHTLAPPAAPDYVLRIAALICIALATMLSIAAYRRWRSVERAMAAGSALPGPGAAPLLAVGVSMVSALVAARVLWWW
ncbi:YidH family protein [Nocardia sp. CWNU-33]|uniref:YidH family protein n=1 Tax=Nocardia sp. CWNU-33 TaxID=3392117 RepID=UPI00398E5BB6